MLLTGCNEKLSEEQQKQNELNFIQEGKVVYHKLSNSKCVVRNIGKDGEGWGGANVDYDQMECVFEDGTANWVYKSEYQTKPIDKNESE